MTERPGEAENRVPRAPHFVSSRMTDRLPHVVRKAHPSGIISTVSIAGRLTTDRGGSRGCCDDYC
jgi:hypothetical protein